MSQDTGCVSLLSLLTFLNQCSVWGLHWMKSKRTLFDWAKTLIHQQAKIYSNSLLP